MNKKGLTIVITALVLGVFVFGMAGGVFAQSETPEVETTEESLTAPVVTRKGHGYQNSLTVSGEEDVVPLGFAPGDGTCDGEALGFGPGNGTCDIDGDGEPIQQRLQNGSGEGSQYGMGQGQGASLGQGLGTGTGENYGAGQGAGAGRGTGGAGLGMGPGEGLYDGAGLHDGSCIDD